MNCTRCPGHGCCSHFIRSILAIWLFYFLFFLAVWSLIMVGKIPTPLGFKTRTSLLPLISLKSWFLPQARSLHRPRPRLWLPTLYLEPREPSLFFIISPSRDWGTLDSPWVRVFLRLSVDIPLPPNARVLTLECPNLPPHLPNIFMICMLGVFLKYSWFACWELS